MDNAVNAADARKVRAVRQRLESLERAGITSLRRIPAAGSVPPVAAAVAAATVAPASPVRDAVQPAPAAQAVAALPADDRVAALAAVARQVASCTRCAGLARSRTQTVFGVGNPHARLVFIGEAPGADEDRQGEPFVGAAGQLLNKIIAACGMRREDVYILNILKCRPPGNRTPQPVEAAACREYLDRQLEIIKPQFICCLGAVAAQNLLQRTSPIGALRGRFHNYNGIKVLCTYHPAYLLRNPAAKRPTWEDMQMLLSEMGIEAPKR